MKTFCEHIEEYLRSKQAGRPARTVTSAKSYLGRFERWLESRKIQMPEQLTSAHIGQWLTHVQLQRNKYSGLPLKPFTIHSHLMVVRAFTATLVRHGFISAGLLDAFPQLRKPPILPKSTLKHAEVRKMLRGMPTHGPRLYMLRTISELAYTTAARPCELLALNASDLNFESELLRVLGKGQKERMLPVGRTAMRILENYVRAIRPLLLRDPKENALWLNESGRRLSYDRLLAMLHRHVPASFGRKVTWYTFRRSCATEMARAGANLWAIKELLGHDHIETVRHYVHFTIEDLKKAHDRCHPRNFPAQNNLSHEKAS
jgi:integrase/recombinase XerD